MDNSSQEQLIFKYIRFSKLESLKEMVEKQTFIFDIKFLNYAAEVGNLTIVKYLDSLFNKRTIETVNCAAKKERLVVLQWLLNNGYPIEEETKKYCVKDSLFIVTSKLNSIKNR